VIFLMCYDISSPRRLRKAAKVLERYGIRVQYSFFQCDAPPEVLDTLVTSVREEIDENVDRFYIYPLCSSCTRLAETDGTGELVKLEPFVIV